MGAFCLVSVQEQYGQVSERVSEQFLNDTSAQCRLCSAILLKAEEEYPVGYG